MVGHGDAEEFDTFWWRRSGLLRNRRDNVRYSEGVLDFLRCARLSSQIKKSILYRGNAVHAIIYLKLRHTQRTSGAEGGARRRQYLSGVDWAEGEESGA